MAGFGGRQFLVPQYAEPAKSGRCAAHTKTVPKRSSSSSNAKSTTLSNIKRHPAKTKFHIRNKPLALMQ
ncbi:hypothetical protein BLL52_3540 [Rhodoferax antarcticus ANT.BR]|uniref:Uncharacterized protein n=1 Tax=Rhodoferax antarcticus ANT.BR TaxID=1111071 RepID=A0A1Q8YBE9_9BURK|nr:hypothetical protein BLL52_3540 [Rhodoferax antarcticus ANT.BR]